MWAIELTPKSYKERRSTHPNKYEHYHGLHSNGTDDLLVLFPKPNLSTFPENIKFLNQSFGEYIY